MKKLTRRGFTLPEILVTVTVIAVLAAVVVPTVLQYVNKGDVPSALSEIDAIKKGVIGFTADTRHYPSTLNQLTGSISSTDSDLNNATYEATGAALWKGPYFEGQPSESQHTTKTLGLVFENTLVKCGTAPATFICLSILPGSTWTSLALDTLDMKIDGGTGVAGSGQNSGNLIWTGASSTPTAIYIKLGVAN